MEGSLAYMSISFIWKTVQKHLLPAAVNGFSNGSDIGNFRFRNRPQFAIRAQFGLFGTSMSRNCWRLYGTIRKSHSPSQWQQMIFVLFPTEKLIFFYVGKLLFSFRMKKRVKNIPC